MEITVSVDDLHLILTALDFYQDDMVAIGKLEEHNPDDGPSFEERGDDADALYQRLQKRVPGA